MAPQLCFLYTEWHPVINFWPWFSDFFSYALCHNPVNGEFCQSPSLVGILHLELKNVYHHEKIWVDWQCLHVNTNRTIFPACPCFYAFDNVLTARCAHLHRFKHQPDLDPVWIPSILKVLVVPFSIIFFNLSVFSLIHKILSFLASSYLKFLLPFKKYNLLYHILICSVIFSWRLGYKIVYAISSLSITLSSMPCYLMHNFT